MFKIEYNLTGSKQSEFQPLFEVIETIYPAPRKAAGSLAYYNTLLGIIGDNCMVMDKKAISCSTDPREKHPEVSVWGREYQFFVLPNTDAPNYPRISLDCAYCRGGQRHKGNDVWTRLLIETGLPTLPEHQIDGLVTPSVGPTFSRDTTVDMFEYSLRMVAELLRRFDKAQLLEEDCPRKVKLNAWRKEVLMAGHPEPTVTTAHLAATLDYLAGDRDFLEGVCFWTNKEADPRDELMLSERRDEVRALLRAKKLPDPPVPVVGGMKVTG